LLGVLAWPNSEQVSQIPTAETRRHREIHESVTLCALRSFSALTTLGAPPGKMPNSEATEGHRDYFVFSPRLCGALSGSRLRRSLARVYPLAPRGRSRLDRDADGSDRIGSAIKNNQAHCLHIFRQGQVLGVGDALFPRLIELLFILVEVERHNG
jgi:hypothetical protein